MNQKITKLAETVINQIAAGEVVENPASIVKELVENSLDAGSKRIAIDWVGGGHNLIRIEDDGCGMGPEDALLALERHATSKIRDVADLETLSTMGFRGEALAAISSVSHFEMKTSDGKSATHIVVEGGRISKVEVCARNRGTTLEVRSLFYNVPARRKFQKSPSACSAQITKVIETIAIAHPEVTFILNGQRLEAAGLEERLASILGTYEHRIEGKRISGFVAAPNQASSTRVGQLLFVNKRPVFSPLIAKAVKEGVGTRIPENLYPKFVLFLELEPDQVDVNVHPQKKEVRFRDEKGLFIQVERAVAKSFEPVSIAPTTSFSFTPALFYTHEPFSFTPEFPEPLPLTFPDRPLALIGRYLLLQGEELLMVDLQAAFARVLFESLTREKPSLQSLLIPLEIPLHGKEEEIAESLNMLGVEFRILNTMLVIDALPTDLEPEEFFTFWSSWKEERKLDRALAKFCQARKKNYSMDEAFFLWKKLEKCRDPLYDPLGRLTFVKIKEEELWTHFASKR